MGVLTLFAMPCGLAAQAVSQDGPQMSALRHSGGTLQLVWQPDARLAHERTVIIRPRIRPAMNVIPQAQSPQVDWVAPPAFEHHAPTSLRWTRDNLDEPVLTVTPGRHSY